MNVDKRTVKTPSRGSRVRRQQYIPSNRGRRIRKQKGELTEQLIAAIERTNDILAFLLGQSRCTGAMKDQILALSALAKGSSVKEHLATKLVDQVKRDAQV